MNTVTHVSMCLPELIVQFSLIFSFSLFPSSSDPIYHFQYDTLRSIMMPMYLSHVLTRPTILQIPRILPWFLPHVDSAATLTRQCICDKGFHSPFVHANIPYPCAHTACTHHHASCYIYPKVTGHQSSAAPFPIYYITLGLPLGSDRAVLLQVSHSERRSP